MTNVTSDIITSKVSIYNILFGKKTAEPSIIVAAEKLGRCKMQVSKADKVCLLVLSRQQQQQQQQALTLAFP